MVATSAKRGREPAGSGVAAEESHPGRGAGRPRLRLRRATGARLDGSGPGTPKPTGSRPTTAPWANIGQLFRESATAGGCKSEKESARQ